MLILFMEYSFELRHRNYSQNNGLLYNQLELSVVN